jgi:hypothetical protein
LKLYYNRRYIACQIAIVEGTAINTVVKLLREVGAACLEYQDKVMHDLPCKHIQCDEIWSFVYSGLMYWTSTIG